MKKIRTGKIQILFGQKHKKNLKKNMFVLRFYHPNPSLPKLAPYTGSDFPQSDYQFSQPIVWGYSAYPGVGSGGMYMQLAFLSFFVWRFSRVHVASVSGNKLGGEVRRVAVKLRHCKILLQ